MNEIDDIKRRAGINEGDENHEALVHAHALLHRLYMDILQGKLDDDRNSQEYRNNVMRLISTRLGELSKFTGMNVPR